MRTFDVVVIGGGPGGEESAGRLVREGLDVALVEDRLVGGECAFWACMPSKALLRPYEALREVRRVPGAADAVTGELDVAAVLRRRDEVVRGMDDSTQLGWIDKTGITLFRGHGRLTGERRVMVGDEEIEARRAVVLAPGSAPLVPPIDGIDGDGVWTNREATLANEIPERLVVIGGGGVGIEMAQAFATLGSRVAVIEEEPRLLAGEEDFACEHLMAALAELGIEVHTGHAAHSVSHDGGTITVATEGGGEVEGDVLLLALGRRPATDDLGLEAVGLTPGDPIEVGAHMQVADAAWLYAVGDVNERALTTHMGKYQARLACDHILGHERAATHGADGPQSPRVFFTDPQVAAVGHTTGSAAEAGIEVDAYDTETSGNAGGSFYGRDAPGTARFVVDRERRVLVGFTITGSDIADFLHAATIAIVGEVPLERLRHAIPPFPTRSEIWLSLLKQAGA